MGWKLQEAKEHQYLGSIPKPLGTCREDLWAACKIVVKRKSDSEIKTGALHWNVMRAAAISMTSTRAISHIGFNHLYVSLSNWTGPTLKCLTIHSPL